jgi:hypothetical protein
VAQDEGPEFKSQYNFKKRKEKKKKELILPSDTVLEG